MGASVLLRSIDLIGATVPAPSPQDNPYAVLSRSKAQDLLRKIYFQILTVKKATYGPRFLRTTLEKSELISDDLITDKNHFSVMCVSQIKRLKRHLRK